MSDRSYEAPAPQNVGCKALVYRVVACVDFHQYAILRPALQTRVFRSVVQEYNSYDISSSLISDL